MANETQQVDVQENRFVGRRLDANALAGTRPTLIAPEYEGGPHRFTLHAFYDNRGPVSVDVFWPDGKLKPKDQRELQLEIQRICATEGQAICGWAFGKVGLLRSEASQAVERVVHSRTDTNVHHANITRRRLLVSQDATDPDRSDKTKLFALSLMQFFNARGRFLAVQAEPGTAAPPAAL